MLKHLQSILLASACIFLLGCDPVDNCSKTVTIPDHFVQTNTGVTFVREKEKIVPCDYADETDYAETAILKNFSYEVIVFKFIPDTGKNSSSLEYEIKLKNNNNFAVKGNPNITLNADGTISTGALGSCGTIEANSSCTISHKSEISHNFGLIKSITLESLKYVLSPTY